MSDYLSVPLLDGVKASHILWADDLVLLAFDSCSLQRIWNLLHEYCTEWGLSVNLEKTAIMTFNKSGRLLKESTGFTYGNTIISPVREYCYLGKTLALNGSFNIVQQKLKTKRSEMIFLKSMIDIRPLKRSVVFKLFDSLVLP